MLPASLAALDKLARNLWWSWDAEATALWERVDPWRWPRCRHNPVALLHDVDDARWRELARDTGFVALVNQVAARFDAYMHATGWCAGAAPAVRRAGVAYFSMEFGLHESLRIYSGGLGILAGDHLRSASDLGVPLVGVGLMYRRGYFRQVIDDGLQIDAYPVAVPDRLPLVPARRPDGEELFVDVPIAGRTVRARVWSLAVGRTWLYLLDTDLPDNDPWDRALTDRLYGGDQHTRISQETLLGVGGVRVLRGLDLTPGVYHLNEGHCAFAILELLREKREEGVGLREALHWIRSRTVFTTHTPVPAGHDRFHWDVVDPILGPWRKAQGLSPGAFMDLGRVQPGNTDEPLCMTVLALKGSEKVNGVSALHGEVSRRMWTDLWPHRDVDDVPIGHVTNGVHPIFWMSPEARAVFDDHLPGWRDAPWDPDVWRDVDDIPDEVLWDLRATLRRRLLGLVAERADKHLDPSALTIGFARRFAPYKRGDLLFTDPDRLAAILDQGVQIVFSGKAHPRDTAGQAIVARVLSWATDRRFRDHVAFVEDYDIVVGRALTAGSDVWLNNPRRPNEASGTSGQKVPLNAGLNLSVLDGWWPEAFDGTNGWALGEPRDYDSVDEQDAADAESLYRTLEGEVLPLWTQRDGGIPHGWLARVRRSIQTCAPAFNSHRMVRDYVLDMYAPLAERR